MEARTTPAAMVVVLTTMAWAQGPGALAPATASAPALEAKARELVEWLANEEYDRAYAQFDATMRRALPAAKLGEAWKAVLGVAGPFRRAVSTRTERVGGYDAVFVTCQFERQRLDAKVVFTAEARVTGLFFVPASVAVGSFAAPPYADAKAFREQTVQVGAEGWPLPGTLTMPARSDANGPGAAAVVLVHGSGPHDRDETLGPNKPFRDLAWGLATRGVAVLRYEKRTRRHQTRLAKVPKTFTLREEVVDDAVSAVRRLAGTEGVDARRIFVLGHSLGGTAAPRIARAAPEVAGVIVLAGPTRHLADIYVEQMRYLLGLDGNLSPEDHQRLRELERQAQTARGPALSLQTPEARLPMGIPAAYWMDLRDYDPVATARLIKRPILIIQGGRDYQVTARDLEGWKAGLGEQPGVRIKLYPALNHLMIAGRGRSTPAEYEQPGHVDEAVVADIADWIAAQKPLQN